MRMTVTRHRCHHLPIVASGAPCGTGAAAEDDAVDLDDRRSQDDDVPATALPPEAVSTAWI
jgi:hypothetical protein